MPTRVRTSSVFKMTRINLNVTSSHCDTAVPETQQDDRLDNCEENRETTKVMQRRRPMGPNETSCMTVNPPMGFFLLFLIQILSYLLVFYQLQCRSTHSPTLHHNISTITTITSTCTTTQNGRLNASIHYQNSSNSASRGSRVETLRGNFFSILFFID